MKLPSPRSAILALALMQGGCALSGDAAMTGDRPETASAAAFPAAATGAQTPDPVGTGPYPAMRDLRAELPDSIIYRPRDLDALGGVPLGVVLWGNGGCSADAASARYHLLELASYGYVVIAPGRAYSGPGALPMPVREVPDRPGAFPPVQTMPSDLLARLDRILAENRRAGSPFFGRIDPAMVAVAGHSCGGLQAISVAADPRIATAIVHNSGVLDPDAFNPITGFSVAKSELRKLHGPVLYVLGGEGDVAYANGMDDFARIDHVPVAVASLDVGHEGTFRDPNGGRVAPVAVRWLEWQLRGDAAAARWFVGEECRLCTDADWSFEARGL